MPLAFDATHGKLVIAGGGPAVVAVDVGSGTVLRLTGACYNSSSSCRVLPWDSAPAVRLPRRQAELQERIQRLLQTAAANPEPGSRETLVRQRLGLSESQWQLLAQQRRLNRPVPLEGELLELVEAPSQEPGPEEAPMPPVEALLSQLEPRQRQVVRQVVLAGWSYRRLALQMQVSPMTIQRLLHRGLEQLRTQLDQATLRPASLACSAGSVAPGC